MIMQGEFPIRRGTRAALAAAACAGWLATALALLGATSCDALTVTQPTATTVVAPGDDYATQVLGNAWDMSDAVDIDTEESGLMSAQTFAGGLFSGTTTGAGGGVYPLFMGYGNSINLSRGANFPIDTAHYRFLTIKLRDHSASQNVNAYYLLDANSYGEGTFGTTQYFPLTANQWTTVTIDLVNNSDPSSAMPWTSHPFVTGLRVDPANGSGVSFDIDWIRLTAPATAAQLTTVAWTDSGYTGTYKIEALDVGTAADSYTLASSVGGSSYAADLSFLAPGQYQIRVTRNGDASNASSATFRINAPPQVALTTPSVRGDQAQSFATVLAGHSWGPPPSGAVISSTSFSLISNFSNVSYSNPTGTFYGRPTNADPGWRMNLGGHTVDPAIYRSVCFTMQVFGVRDLGNGSVARFFWSSNGSTLTTSALVALDSGLSEYCVPDLAVAPVADASGGAWLGAAKNIFRLDPIEFAVSAACTNTPSAANCHDVQLNSVVLAPFAQANPGYTIAWNLADSDTASVGLSFYLDPDTTAGNGNEIAFGSATASAGNGQLVWPGSGSAPYGTYHVLVVANDGVSSVSQYAGGPLVIGARDGIFRNGFDSLH